MRGTYSFETIRNNTALKRTAMRFNGKPRFETIRNNTALKPVSCTASKFFGFETIRNNTALKRLASIQAIACVLKPFQTTQL